MEVDPHGLEVLDRAACLELLGTVGSGRLGLSIDALPVVISVSFVVDGDALTVTAVGDERLGAALTGAIVALQADRHDAVSGTDWSVLVRGWATRLRASVAPGEVSMLHPGLWGGGLRGHRATLSTDLVSGRRRR
jgi:nitroimidazol reductase NimA-like FMN-containing flavoprotein (pyridoxamine 5'-phosphate oxidase superfamily)